MSHPHKRAIAAVLAVCYASALLAVGHVSRPFLSGALVFSGSDKLLHALSYGLLGLVVYIALNLPSTERTALRALMGLALVAAVGAVDEWQQSFVPGRHSDVWDLVADLSGASVALVAVLIWRRQRRVGV